MNPSTGPFGRTFSRGHCSPGRSFPPSELWPPTWRWGRPLWKGPIISFWRKAISPPGSDPAILWKPWSSGRPPARHPGTRFPARKLRLGRTSPTTARGNFRSPYGSACSERSSWTMGRSFCCPWTAGALWRPGRPLPGASQTFGAWTWTRKTSCWARARTFCTICFYSCWVRTRSMP